MPRDGAALGGRLLGGRPGGAARAPRRRGVLHRPLAGSRELPRIEQAPRRRRPQPRRRGRSGVRLSRRERGVRPGVHRRRADVRRAAARAPSRRWGTSSRSRSIAAAAGVPARARACASGWTAPEEAVRRAIEIGFPVMLKASAGGGGKGLRIARDAGEVRRAAAADPLRGAGVASATTPSTSRSTSSARATSRSRCWATHHGNLVHLGDRECSLQRRHQKVVEEAPSPLMTPELRARMGEAALSPRPRRGLLQRRHRGVPRRRRPQLLLPRDEHAAAGRAPGDRDGHRRRHRRRRSSASPPASSSGFGQEDVTLHRPRHGVPHLRRGPGQRLRRPARAASPASTSPRAPASATTTGCTRGSRSRSTTTR